MAGVMSLFSLSGRTAVVTGGTRGIGQAMAVALAEAGADIVLIQVCGTSWDNVQADSASEMLPTHQLETISSIALVAKHGSMSQSCRVETPSKASSPR